MTELLLRAVVDVPTFDDYDAIVDFLNRWVATDSSVARLRLLFLQHIEHRPALLRAAAAATHGALGHVDHRVLQAFGAAALPLLAAALFAGFRPGQAARERILPFAPAALLLFHPQFWSAYLWPSCSATNFYAVAFAAVAFHALSLRGWRSFALAAGAATLATFSQGNGVAVLPIGFLVLVGPEQRARRRAWLAFAIALGALSIAPFERPFDAWDALANLASAKRIGLLAGYVLNFLGSAAAFSQRGIAPFAGAALVASLLLLLWRGAWRRSPALVALLCFLLVSAGLNALVRAKQGSAAPLFQDRYRFYASAFLAATWLAWAAELVGTRWLRGALAGGLALSLAFCGASHTLYRGKLLDMSGRLEAGLERWWTTGEGGLFYPRFEKASQLLLTAFARGVLRVPSAWIAEHASLATSPPLPEPGASVRFELGTLRRDPALLLVDGWAHAGDDARGQRVALVLRSELRTLVFPALSVPRIDLPDPRSPQARRLARSGFRLLVPSGAIPPDAYRIGVLVERAGQRWLSLGDDARGLP
ncbi:MAG: hypothetical protein E4H11_09480 [Myxococcales bacterium]|nr:MAG: hypothetical protein E4H11_09480 [Myxococcales bacterium]